MSRSSNSSKSDASGSAEKQSRQAKRRRTKHARPASGFNEEKAELTPTQNNQSASFLPTSATNVGITPFTTMSGPPFLVDPSNDRANIESIRRLVAMSSANMLVRTAPLPTPALFPVLNSFPPLGMLTEPQQLLRYQLNAALQNVAIRELASGYLPSLGQYNPPTSLTISNLEGINLANSRLGSMFMQPSFPPGLMAPAPHLLQHSSRPRTAPFARAAVPNEARDYDSQVFEDGRQAVMPFAGSHATSASSSIQEKRKHRKRERTTSVDDGNTEIILFVSEDYEKLNDHQILLRKQIELFRATQDDIFSYTRGKNKPIFVQQVGIRCRHCSHIPVGMRQKGSTYFPSNLMGIYQAAQNLNVEHLQSGLCPETPPDVRNQFMEFASTKAASSGVGKKYWAEAAQKLGLVDTEDGIRFAADMH